MSKFENLQVQAEAFEHKDLNAEEFYAWLIENVPKSKQSQILRDYFMITKNPYSMCIGLEFLFMHGYYQELNELIKKNIDIHKHNELNQNWANLFKLILAKQHRIYPIDYILKQTQLIKAIDLPLKCLRELFILSIYFDIFEYEIVANKLDHLKVEVQAVQHPLLVQLFGQRLDRILFFYYWKRNEMLLARKHGFSALSEINNRVQLANLHVNFSLSYIFDDFESSVYHLEEAYKIATEENITRLIRLIENQNKPFIYAHFNQPGDITTPDKSEQAHLAIARGEFKCAQSLLSEVPETPFTKYYLGRAYQDRRILLQAYNDFIEKRSDHFFARLPLVALKNL
ncbi:AimR family lysis-lysogeny pheromone receptor [Amphibacillus sediminis]|uniref:AimR family lysis-lysogeny pheromone receptor n=1 Tax=Amphibacillus sediminis TaxID=360185 RepID=UPI00082C8F8E|nr:AimR family lysis-lysogeny pheromone receptor [Amphibacillus sediminis]